jgi:hypothetical protein
MVSEPYFDKCVVGMFVRLSIGQSKNSRTVKYRMCEVEFVATTSAAYEFGGGSAAGSGQNTINKALLLNFAGMSKKFPMTLISNSRITPQEFADWQRAMNRKSIHVLSKEEALRKRKKSLKAQKEFVYDAETVQRMLQQKKLKSLDRVNVAFEKDRLTLELNDAIAEDNTDKQKEIRARLQQLADHAERLRQKRQSAVTQSIISLNAKHADINRKFLRKASENERKLDARVLAGDVVVDAFSRRPTRPKQSWDIGKEDKADAARKERKAVAEAQAVHKKRAQAAAAAAAKKRQQRSCMVIDGGDDDDADLSAVATAAASNELLDQVTLKAWKFLNAAYTAEDLAVDMSLQPYPKFVYPVLSNATDADFSDVIEIASVGAYLQQQQD